MRRTRVINSGSYTLADGFKQNFSTTNESLAGEHLRHRAHEPAGPRHELRRCARCTTISCRRAAAARGTASRRSPRRTTRSTPTDERRRDVARRAAEELRHRPAGERPRRATRSSSRRRSPTSTQATEGEGVRFNKFPPLPNAPTGDAHPNDFPFFRLAEMYLIKAEALNELGQRGRGARAGEPRSRTCLQPAEAAAGLSAAARDAILKERLFEFAGEGKRRQDMIRHGHVHGSAAQFKSTARSLPRPVPDPGNADPDATRS